MRYKRGEAFRYVFGEPLPILFHLTKIDGKPIESSSGQAQMIDLSPKGMRMYTTFNLPDSKKRTILLEVHFSILGEQFAIEGEIVWQETSFDGGYYYGIGLFIAEEEKNRLINSIKNLAKKP
ncbi:hypothetical protein Q73_15350 [Bacillus coahuilensis m2-6]|uniref:PilZ domain-containing protein n=1 Tax=Bacillus coahuilensis TaxID=408580 RepID=UPI0001850715|nr:PilZ domain-containing protein [Bacillus coahuilensis]KUP04504.1 hypothetical protein Q73_15350 [Bacillus coahuilensis m2-6]